MIKNLHINEFIRMISLMKKRAWIYVSALIFSALANAGFGIILAFVNKELIETTTSGNMQRLFNIVIPCVSAFFLICLVFPTLIYIKVVSIRKTITEMKLRLFKRIENFPVNYFEKSHSGDILSRITNDVNVIENALDNQMQVLVYSIFSGVGSAISMFLISWQLSILTIIIGIISAIVNASFSNPFRTISDKLQNSLSKIMQNLIDFILGIRIIKIFGIEKVVAKEYMNEADEISSLTMERVKKNSQLNCINYVLSSFNLIGVFIAGTFMVKLGSISFGNVVAIITLQNGLNFMLLNFGNFFAQIQGSLAGSVRVFDLFDQEEEPEKYCIKGTINKEQLIDFAKVSFNYGESKNILADLSFSIKKGDILGIVGKSGSGKSTIVKILMGFYCPNNGNITIDGNSMSDYTLKEIRNKIAYVPQEPTLFDGTIEDNIRFGNLSATEKEIIEAANKANIHKFISTLPNGYKAEVGEGGCKLSGGQKQRIAIARALLKKADILVFDEATSALDSESEGRILKEIYSFRKKQTIIIIAHRLSNIKNADNIIFVEEGTVIETGTHEELLTNKGNYYKLYNSQFNKEVKV